MGISDGKGMMTHIEGVIEIKIIMAIKVAAHELVDLLLVSGMDILEFMHGLELDDIEAIWKHAVWLALEEMLTLIGSDVGDSGENVGAVSSGSLDAISVVDTAFSGLVIHVKVLEIIVKVDRSGAKVSTKQSGVGGKNSGDVDVTFTA